MDDISRQESIEEPSISLKALNRLRRSWYGTLFYLRRFVLTLYANHRHDQKLLVHYLRSLPRFLALGSHL